MFGPFDPVNITASVAANLATTMLQARAGRIPESAVSEQLVKLGLIKSSFSQRINDVLSRAINDYFAANQSYRVSGVVQFFSDPVVARLISEYLLEGREINKTVILGYLADHLDVPRTTNPADWPGGLDPIRFWDDFERQLTSSLGSEADPGLVWLSRRLNVVESRIALDAAEISSFRERFPNIFIEASAKNTNSEWSHFENQYLNHLSERFGQLATPGARDLRGVNQSLSVAYITLNVKTRALTTAVPAEEFLLQHPKLAIRGPAGSGKTTLISWLTWSCTNKIRETPWRGGIPFVVPLRRIAVEENGPPRVEQFVNYSVDPAIWSMSPPGGWIDNVLRTQKRGLVMLDGLDELPSARRPAFWEWLSKFDAEFPGNRVIVTSRTLPGSIIPDRVNRSEQWNPPSTFIEAQLQEMSDDDIGKFIEHWHNSVDTNNLSIPEKTELLLAKAELPKKLSDSANRRIRELCSTPLLCAMVCVLHWRDEGYLPRQRIELYSRCCDMLIEARDLKRGIVSTSGPIAALTKDDKELVLQRLALDMMRNKPDSDDDSSTTYRIEITRAKALDWISSRIPNLSNADARTATATQLLDHLIERTGLLREPSTGWIDFPHRTFQEYLAACAAGAEGQEAALAKQVDDDQWHETIMLAAGTPAGGIQFGRSLIEALVRRGEQHKSQKERSQRIRKTCFALALGCLENLRQQDPGIRDLVISHLSELVPPHNTGDAHILAVAGDAVVPYLRYSKYRDDRTSTVAACAQALRLIGTTAAVRELGDEYVNDSREAVIAEICAIESSSYDRIPLVARAVKDTGRLPGFIQVKDIKQISQLEGLRHLRISSRFPKNLEMVKELRELDGLTLHEVNLIGVASLEWPMTLKEITMFDCKGQDVQWLRRFEALTSLSVYNVELSDNFDSLRDLNSLNKLLLHAVSVQDLEAVVSLPNLSDLTLRGCNQIRSLVSLEKLRHLNSLRIENCSKIEELDPALQVASISALAIENTDQQSDLNKLSSLPVLKSLELASFTATFLPGSFEKLSGLSSLSLSNFSNLVDVQSLSSLHSLTKLKIHNCPRVKSLGSIQNLAHLNQISLRNLDIDSLNGIPDAYSLTEIRIQNCRNLHSFEGIKNCKNLQEFSLIGCSSLAELSILSDLRNLRRLTLIHCEHLDDLSALSSLESLENLTLTECPRVISLASLASLQLLREIDIVACQGIQSLAPLESCKSLEKIGLSINDLGNVDVPETLQGKVSRRFYVRGKIPYRIVRKLDYQLLEVFDSDFDFVPEVVYSDASMGN